ncbi:MAG: RnfABCDGE type electron transport complex subunit G [Roseburia sp.]|nr:RnfABCDGE type electron transport complex subunit G [Roseburia sp.]MCM1097297.1 RnfABCDGE type electron transport complex subunit G [Ruminococcus flavefaciens]
MRDNGGIKTMLREAGILFGITLIAGLLLGFVYELTKEPRRIQQEKAVQEACVAVFPQAKEQELEISFTPLEYTLSEETEDYLAAEKVTVGALFRAEYNGSFYGYVVEASAKGYGGNIVLYVGVGADGTVNGVTITQTSETPGLGLEASGVLTPQFAGKKYESFVYTKTGAGKNTNEVDAISGATITTKAVTAAVNGGLRAALELLEGGAANE